MTHDQVRQLVRRVNPVPDPSVLESVEAPVLETERSKDMQVDDRPVTEKGHDNRWRGPLIGIAAAAIVLIGGLIFTNTRQADVATPAPNAVGVPGNFAPVAPGAYFVDTDGGDEGSIRGTFVVEGEGWTGFTSGVLNEPDDGGETYTSLLVVEVDDVYRAICFMSAAPTAAEPTPARLADQFAQLGFTVTEDVTPTVAFGHDGYKLVVEVPEGCAGDQFHAWNGGTFEGRYYQEPGQVIEYYFLDIDGTPVMVEATWFPDSSDEDIAELREVLETLVITP